MRRRSAAPAIDPIAPWEDSACSKLIGRSLASLGAAILASSKADPIRVNHLLRIGVDTGSWSRLVAHRTPDIAAPPSAATAASIRVVLADDSLLVREAIERILEREPGLELVASCADGTALLAAVERERPAVVVTDVRMPPRFEDEGIELARVLRDTHPEVGVVVLSQYADPRLGLALLEHGSDGRAYLLKERVHDRHQLTSAIETVAHGGSVMDARVVEAMIAQRSGAADSPLAALSPRELEILGEIAQGKSNQAIADSLVLTKRAVEKHINSIFFKLDLGPEDDVHKRVKAALLFLSATTPRAVAVD